MSVKAMTWVFDHSPYTLGTYLVHIVIADIVNEDNDWMLWASQPKLARKARVSVPTVSAAINRMISDGYLEKVEERPGHATTYRFLRPTPQISEGYKSTTVTPQIHTPKPPKSTESHLLLTQEEPKRTQGAHERNVYALADFANAQTVRPPSGKRRQVLGVISDALRCGVSYEDIHRAIERGVLVWTEDGLRTTIARTRTTTSHRRPLLDTAALRAELEGT